tara:strand:- start:254 stop:1927 length:1674 start_codon:yes stop_codon:yes gene_type:complete
MSTKIYLPLLKKIRQELDMTQEMLAEMAGVTTRTIQRIEAGHHTSLSTAKDLASSLELSSYQCLFDKKEEKKREAEEKVKEFEQRSSIFIYENKSRILIAMMTLLTFISLVDVNSKISTYTYGALNIIPLCFLIVATAGKRGTKKGDTPPSFFTYLLLATMYLLFSISTLFLTTLSLADSQIFSEIKDFQSVRLSMPGVVNFISLSKKYEVVIWLTSLIIANFSAFGIYKLVSREEKKDVCFGFFPGCLIIATFFFSFTSRLLENVNYINELRLAWLLIAIIPPVSLYFMIKSFSGVFKNADSEVKKIESKNLKAAILTLQTPMIALFLVASLEVKVKELARLDLDHEYRAEHCQQNPSYNVCWSVNLLKEHNIPATPVNIMLLDSLNGQALSPAVLFSEINVSMENLKGETPFPAVFYDFTSESYASILEYSPNPSALIKDWSDKDLVDILVEPKENLKWALMAKNDFPMFLKKFEEASGEIKKDKYLLTIFNTHQGIWKVREYENSKNYRAGMLSFATDSEGEIIKYGDKVVTFDTLKKIYELPRDRFPKNRINK